MQKHNAKKIQSKNWANGPNKHFLKEVNYIHEKKFSVFSHQSNEDFCITLTYHHMPVRISIINKTK